MDTISLRNRQESPLLRLPGEIRNRVYEYVLGGKIIGFYLKRRYSTDFDDYRRHGCKSLESTTVPTLLHVTMACRQIYAETDLYVFKMNEFYFSNECSFNNLVEAVAPRQLETIQTYIWPQKCGDCKDHMLAKMVGLRTIVVRLRDTDNWSDFYIPDEHATPRVHSRYEQTRHLALTKIDKWQKQGIEVEYVE